MQIIQSGLLRTINPDLKQLLQSLDGCADAGEKQRMFEDALESRHDFKEFVSKVMQLVK